MELHINLAGRIFRFLFSRNFFKFFFRARLMMEQIPQIFLADHVLHLENGIQREI